MALPYRTTGSLRPTFVPARLVGLAVKRAFAFIPTRDLTTLSAAPFCTVTLCDRPSQTIHQTRSSSRITGHRVRTSTLPGWYFKDGSTGPASVPASKPPTVSYTRRSKFRPLQAKHRCGSSVPGRGYTASSHDFDFTEPAGDSAAIIMLFIRAGRNLPYV